MSFGGGSGSSSISGSTDVVLNSPANNDVLGYNSGLAKWQNRDLSSTYLTAFLPEKYGAVGDGIADDGPGLLAASAAAATFGGTLWLSPKNYKVTSTLVLADGVKVAGTGRIFGALVGTAVITVGGNGTTLTDLTVENTDTSTGNIGVNVRTGATNVTIQDVTFKGPRLQAVNINTNGVAGVLVRGCLFDGVTYGVLTDTSGTTGLDLRDVRIIGNRFINVSGDPIELNSPITGMGKTRTPRTDAQAGFVISGNYISNTAGSDVNSGFGIGIAGACDVTISGNNFVGSRVQAIHIEDYANGVTITGNTINGGAVGIYMISHANGITITGNTINGTTSHGIQSEINVGEMAFGYTITSNSIAGAGGDGMRLYATSATGVDMDATVTGNTVKSCTGDGINVDPAHTCGLILTGNTTFGNTGGGLRIGQGFGGQTGRNISYDNTGGNHLRSGVIPIRMSDIGGKVVVAALAATTTAWAPLFTLGQRMNGTVMVTANLAAGTEWQSRIFTITWDGATMVATQVSTASSAGALDGVAVRANAGNLEAQNYWAGGATTINFEAAFEGQLLI
jgi:parallel beta-helix repeat protein